MELQQYTELTGQIEQLERQVKQLEKQLHRHLIVGYLSGCGMTTKEICSQINLSQPVVSAVRAKINVSCTAKTTTTYTVKVIK